MIMNTNVNGAVCINGQETSSSTSSHTNAASRRGREVLCERRKVPDAEMSMDGGAKRRSVPGERPVMGR